MISEKLMMSLFALDAYSRSTTDVDVKDDVRLFGLGSYCGSEAQPSRGPGTRRQIVSCI